MMKSFSANEAFLFFVNEAFSSTKSFLQYELIKLSIYGAYCRQVA